LRGHRHSNGRTFLAWLYGCPPNAIELLVLMKLCSKCLEIPLPRSVTRRKTLLYAWLDDNLVDIKPFLSRHVIVKTVDGEILGTDRTVGSFIAAAQSGELPLTTHGP
jgi:hypothetical protein